MAIATAELKKVLVDSGKLSENDFRKIQDTAKRLNMNIEQILLGKGFFSEADLGKILADHYKVAYIDLSKIEIPSEVILSIPKEISIDKKVIIFTKERGTMNVAMSNPLDLETIDYIKKSTGYNVTIYFAFEADINESLRGFQKDIQQVFLDIIEENVEKSKKEKGPLEDVAKKVPIVKLLDTTIEYAVSEGASDIHIEPLEKEVLIRYRIDGVLRDVTTLPKEVHAILVARIKILAGLRIDEHRLPQDGRIKLVVDNAKVSIRVSVMPTFYGEKIVMRILEEVTRRFSLEDLGLSGEALEVTKQNITRPHGMILVTGPTGSGKTTTLYTILGILNTTDVNISTIEDPIEYSMPRINQTQVNHQIGLTFSIGLRSLLRQDPDIIMVGEIRDTETVRISVNAAMTGHLVLTTLHTNNAASSIPRLLDMGVEPFLVASTVNIILAQRLVRKLCSDCKEQYKISAKLLKGLKDELTKQKIPEKLIDEAVGDGKFYKSAGCKKCGDKGFKGRIGVFEVLEMSSKIMEMAVSNATSVELQEQAVSEKMETMLLDGVKKAKNGATTLEEILAVTRE